MPSAPYDALLVVSFGGPEQPSEVMPFLEHVLAGKPVPEARKLAVAKHYYRFEGKSPINDCNRQLVAALSEQSDLPVYWGNRHSTPWLHDTLAEMAEQGVKRALVFLTSALSSYSGCRQYQEDLEAARARIGAAAPELFVLRRFYNHPGFVEAAADYLGQALGELGAPASDLHVVFTAHSIPLSMSATCDYQAQFEELAALVGEQEHLPHFSVAYQSRSGPPTQPWLEPDVLDELGRLAQSGVRNVVVCPIGFVHDHMEVIWDLDIEAKQRAAELGLTLVRARTAGSHPKFTAMVLELVREQTGGVPPRALGRHGPRVAPCQAGCCPAAKRPATPRAG